MPHFYFNILDKHRLIPDTEGQSCTTLEDAHAEALLSARDIIVQRLKNGEELNGDVIQVRDETGRVVDVVRLSDLVN